MFYFKAPQEAINVKNYHCHYSNNTSAYLLVTESTDWSYITRHFVTDQSLFSPYNVISCDLHIAIDSMYRGVFYWTALINSLWYR